MTTDQAIAATAKTVAFHTLGCKVNHYDTESIWQLFARANYRQVDFDDTADVYVINTCTVTQEGDRKSRQMIRRAVRRNPEATVVVTGCYAQMAPGEILGIDGVDLVVGNQDRTRLLEWIEQVQAERKPYNAVHEILSSREFEDIDVPMFTDRTRASLKIQDGCNHFCTFCIIPYARGLVRSRRPGSVMRQARRLADAGYHEIVLTGIHTGGYGEDLQGYTLADLIRELEAIESLRRVRISSIEASEITDDLIAAMGASTKVCHHLHIPLQAGHSEVLRRMNRHYTIEQYADTLAKVRRALPELAITSDVIVGFPGESDEYFAHTEAFVRDQAFAQLHVFPYSVRKGTPAARFVDQVPENVKQERVARLLTLSRELTVRYGQQWQGRTVEVIAEEEETIDGHTLLVGHADNYMRVAFSGDSSQLGELCAVRVDQVTAERAFGTLERVLTHTDFSRLLGEDDSTHLLTSAVRKMSV
ncbi:MAG: tRNA (N(6)-L-threonylcarbamoyladenosine(37)-C(2))-methylthiotransferase MtaB [Firmicutes bacterium]|nr:tRNA (N(6)-L-threonylcarbamoyladenosine(37)-C(2))-methylthiotransferase MtaB [Bacillota bacterium]